MGRIGQIPWNKGKKGVQVAWNKGLKNPQPITKAMLEALKLGRYVGKIMPKGENNKNWRGGKPRCIDCEAPLSTYSVLYCKTHAKVGVRSEKWKGDKVSYGSLHSWVRRWKGKPIECTFCSSTENLQWANISREYQRNLEDWMPLCAKCHWHYDRESGEVSITKDRFPEKYET